MTIPIQQLTTVDVREALLAAVAAGRPLAAVNEFLAEVDWSTVAGDPDPEVQALLGEAEGLAEEAAEGDIPQDTFAQVLEQLASNIAIPAMEPTVLGSALTIDAEARLGLEVETRTIYLTPAMAL